MGGQMVQAVALDYHIPQPREAPPTGKTLSLLYVCGVAFSSLLPAVHRAWGLPPEGNNTSEPQKCAINPRRACAARVTVVVCVSVSVSTTILALQATKRIMSDINSFSFTWARKLKWRFC